MRRILGALGAALGTALVAGAMVGCVAGAAEPAPKAPEPKTVAAGPEEVKPVQLKVPTDWQARAMAWFSSDPHDKKALRKEMRKAGKAIKRPCRYCHTRKFAGYQANRLISQQMMALSAEHDVGCADCHGGRTSFTKMGKAAKDMFELSRRKQVFCEHCHVKKKQFEELTKAGKKQEADWKREREASRK